MDATLTKDRDRSRFRLALGVYVLWVAALAILAVVSGQKPAERPAASARP
ncbi:MAG: hypothetical protein K2X91_09335 [Thermoleophilia bacterium]|nr:hypothetical protein [Thermoleophilia bacterium]